MNTDTLKWEVLFVYKRRLQVKKFRDDFHGALRLYTMLAHDERVQKPALRCANRAFPLPLKLRNRKIPIARRGRVIDHKHVSPMAEVNLKGRWWCPYCIRLRTFKQQNGFTHGGIYVPEPGFYCPACGVSHRDFYVRAFNPHARQAYENPPRAKRSPDKGAVKT